MKATLTLCLLSLLFSASSHANADSEAGKKSPVTFGGFLDTYYAFDFNEPPSKDRAYTTQPLRHNEFNVNLAYLEAKLGLDNVRGRLAVQAGTSVQANYAAETEAQPGSAVGGRVPSLLRHLQEAVVGYRLTDKLWIDGGIYLSHIGLESFISKDNWTYTRSLMADFSPYYQSGVKLSYEVAPAWAVQFHLLNGWQNIVETNDNKAVGLQVAYNPSDKLGVTYNNFYGEETGTLWRFFQDFIVKVKLAEKFQLAGVFDLGLQRNPAGGSHTWYTAALIGRYQLFPSVALTARAERYSDPNKVIVNPSVATGDATLLPGFVVNGGSLGLDWDLAKGLVWRTEVRHLQAEDAIIPSKTGLKKGNTFVVTSFEYAF